MAVFDSSMFFRGSSSVRAFVGVIYCGSCRTVSSFLSQDRSGWKVSATVVLVFVGGEREETLKSQVRSSIQRGAKSVALRVFSSTSPIYSTNIILTSAYVYPV